MTDREALEAWWALPKPALRTDEDLARYAFLAGWRTATAHAERRWLDAVARIESLQQELDKARATGDAERCPTPNDGNAGSEPDFVQTLQGFASMCDSHARGEAVWHSAGIMPEVGRRVVALYNDGSGGAGGPGCLTRTGQREKDVAVKVADELWNRARADAAPARRQALEEAAQIARAHRSKICVNEPVWHDGADWACERIEEAIRAKIGEV